MTKGDIIVISAALILAILVWAGFYVVPRAGALTAVISVDGKEVDRIPVGGAAMAQKAVSLRGGIATVEYGQGKIRVMPLSDHICPNGICWKTGWISRVGQSIVCVPNHMTITLEGASDGVDSVVR